MDEEGQQVQPWITVIIYVIALLAGMVLICTGHATVPEASGYVAPFLVVYERVVGRR